MAFWTFFAPVESPFHEMPRTQARYEPGDNSKPFHADSNTISVLLVPSVTIAIRTPSGLGGFAAMTFGWNGKIPSQASRP
jgi:hypothetical protein